MMKITKQVIDRVTVTREPGDQWPQCPTWGKSFMIEPETLTAEFEHSPHLPDIGLLSLKIEGARIRLLKAGPKPAGPGVIEFSGGRVPAQLHDLLRQIALERFQT